MKNEKSGGQKSTAANPPAHPAWWRADWVFVLGLLAATLAAYQPIWHAGFITDDSMYILNNPWVHQPDGWRKVWVNRADDYVPATSFTFWIEWQLWVGRPLGYHLDNVLLHSLNAILIWRILRRLKIPGARLAALLFALHPVNAATVAWATERKNTLAMAFFAGAILSYLRFDDTGKWRWYGISAAAFAVGILSKSAIAPLPIVLLGICWWRRGGISRMDARRSVLFFALGVGGALLGVGIQHAINHSVQVGPASLAARIAGAGRTVWFYLGKALWPENLTFIYPKWRIDPRDPIAYGPTALIAIAFGVAWYYRRSWGRAVLFSFGYFVAMLVPVMGFASISFMIATPVADHWQYFAIIGPIAGVAAGLTVLFGKSNLGVRSVLCAGLLAVAGVMTWKRSRTYENPLVFWTRNIGQTPGSAVTQSSYGNVLFQLGHVAQSIDHYQQALAIDPECIDANYDLANVYMLQRQPAGAAQYYEKVVKLDPGHLKAFNNLAWILATCPDAALRDGKRAVALAKHADELGDGRNPSEIGTLAAAYAETGQFSMAIATVERAIQLPEVRNQPKRTEEFRAQLDLYRKNLPSRDATMEPQAEPEIQRR